MNGSLLRILHSDIYCIISIDSDVTRHGCHRFVRNVTLVLRPQTFVRNHLPKMGPDMGIYGPFFPPAHAKGAGSHQNLAGVRNQKFGQRGHRSHPCPNHSYSTRSIILGDYSKLWAIHQSPSYLICPEYPCCKLINTCQISGDTTLTPRVYYQLGTLSIR